MSIDTSKHIRLAGGLTAEFLEGIVILFRVHKDPNKVPGDIAETHIAHQPNGGELQLVESQVECATFLFHKDENEHREFKVYKGEMGTLSQRRVVNRFLAQLNMAGGKVQRVKHQEKCS